ncbi:MAG: MacS family sensor histidine kinase [Nocardioides sp.]
MRDAIEDRLFGVLLALRLIFTVNLVGLNLVRSANFDRPVVGVGVVLVLVGWTGVASWAYARPHRRRTALLLADLGVALAAMLASVIAKGPDLRATIPGFWVGAPLLAWAIRWGWRGGLAAAVPLAVVDFGVREEFTQVNYSNVLLLLIGGPLVGYLSESLTAMAVERDRAQRAAAIADERARLARAVHDGVLQVLTLVQRGSDEALARLAGRQEAALRALIRQQDSLSETESRDRVDLVAALEKLESLPEPRVQVSSPGYPIQVPAAWCEEFLSIAGEGVANIARHVGPAAPAWVFLDASGSELVLSVRDEGPGIGSDRLAEAAATGRFGVSQSIQGRAVALGGSARLTTGESGTEWEICVPRPDARV